jgi:hypothetical protein
LAIEEKALGPEHPSTARALPAGEELMLHQLGRPPEAGPNPYHWKNGKLYYRGKPCVKAKPPEDN